MSNMSTEQSLVITGDVHGYHKMNREYLTNFLRDKSAMGVSGVVQLGDFGFNWMRGAMELQSVSENINPPADSRLLEKELEQSIYPHWYKVIGGNHDNYSGLDNDCRKTPIFLGDYGTTSFGGIEFFFIRGANSIDKDNRTIGVDWWEDEELSYSTLMTVIDQFKKSAPKIVLSHTCPQSILPYLGKSSDFPTPFEREQAGKTSAAMDLCLSLHKPKVWIFGHHHTTASFYLKGTHFVCLNELQSVLLFGNGEVKW